MTDSDTSREDFEQFIRSNRDMIMKILEEDRTSEMKDGIEHARSRVNEIRETVEAPARDAFRNTTNTILKVLADEEVQKHFITGAMELLMCFESMIRAMPMSDEMREVVDNAEKTKEAAIKNIAVTGAKTEAKNHLEKVNITNIKDKFDERFHGRDENKPH